MDDVRGEWLRRVEAEYTSAALTQHLSLWLIQVTAPLELVRLGLSIVEDELVHAELSQAVYAAAQGNAAARLARERLALRVPAHEPLELAIARVALETFCLGETVAVRLFSRLRHGAEEPVVLTAFERILKDEVKHREFGWTLLEWSLAGGFEQRVRELAAHELPAMFQRLRASYAYAALGSTADVGALERRWGLMAPREYAAALEETFERDYVPRFAEQGIDARPLWSARLAAR